MDHSTFFSSLQFPLTDHLWFFEIVIGILVLVIVNFLFRKMIKHVRHRSLSIAHGWREKIDQILFLPFQILIFILAITLVIEISAKKWGFSFFENYIDAFRSSGFVLCVAWVLLRWKTAFQKELLNKEQHRLIDRGLIHVISKILSIVIVVMALMIVLQVWGLNIGPLIAFGGIGAAAVGFAGKDVIANFCSSLMLHINRPFMVGDLIHLPDRHLEGYVEEIGWYLTTVRDKDKRPVYLPNSIFSNALVINGSRMTHRRIEEKVGVRYEDFSKIPVLIENIKRVISNHPDIDTHLPISVVLLGFNQFTLDIYMDIYTLQTRYDKYLVVKHEILTLVYQEVLKIGAEMPVPMMAISGKIHTYKDPLMQADGIVATKKLDHCR